MKIYMYVSIRKLGPIYPTELSTDFHARVLHT